MRHPPPFPPGKMRFFDLERSLPPCGSPSEVFPQKAFPLYLYDLFQPGSSPFFFVTSDISCGKQTPRKSSLFPHVVVFPLLRFNEPLFENDFCSLHSFPPSVTKLNLPVENLGASVNFLQDGPLSTLRFHPRLLGPWLLPPLVFFHLIGSLILTFVFPASAPPPLIPLFFEMMCPPDVILFLCVFFSSQ